MGALPKIPRILSIVNQKGGVGKTTTAINLATALAAIGENVLVVDLDPQGNASTGLGVERKNRTNSIYDALMGEVKLTKIIVPTAVPRLSLVPSNQDLLGLDLEIGTETNRTKRLRSVIKEFAEKMPKKKEKKEKENQSFTYIICDCPPSLTLLTINALTASHAVIVPLQCEFFALEGLSQLLRSVEQVKENLNEELTIQGIVLTMYDARNNLANQVVQDVRATMGKTVYETVIPRNVRLSEAPSYGKPALLYDLKCVGSQAYLRLASEMIQRERHVR